MDMLFPARERPRQRQILSTPPSRYPKLISAVKSIKNRYAASAALASLTFPVWQGVATELNRAMCPTCYLTRVLPAVGAALAATATLLGLPFLPKSLVQRIRGIFPKSKPRQ